MAVSFVRLAATLAIGGLAIGLCESFSSSYISSQYSDLIVFALLIAVMLVRPQGVFGQPPLQKV